MKKLLSILLAVCLCSSFGLLFTSCDEHDHNFSERWKFDSVSHWQECASGSSCSKTSDKAEHTWGERADGESEGATVCTVCLAIKGWPGSEEEWEEALAKEKFENVTVTYTVKGEDEEVAKTYTVKITKEAFERVEGNTEAFERAYLEAAAEKKEVFLNSFLPLISRYLFAFDAQNGCYVTLSTLFSGMNVVGSVNVSVPGGNFKDGDTVTTLNISKGTLTFDSEGRLLYFSGTVTESESRVYEVGDGSYKLSNISQKEKEVTYTFSDYGTTVVPVAEG